MLGLTDISKTLQKAGKPRREIVARLQTPTDSRRDGWTGGGVGLGVKDNIITVIIPYICTTLYGLHEAFTSISNLSYTITPYRNMSSRK